MQDCREIGKAFKQLGGAADEKIACLDKIGSVYEELGNDWEKQVGNEMSNYDSILKCPNMAQY